MNKTPSDKFKEPARGTKKEKDKKRWEADLKKTVGNRPAPDKK